MCSFKRAQEVVQVDASPEAHCVGWASPGEGSGLLGRPIPAQMGRSALAPSHPVICMLDWVWLLCALFHTKPLALGYGPQWIGSPEITGKQVLGLAKCWVLRPKRQCSWLGPGHGAESCPLLLSSTAARFALNFLGFLPTVPILISKDMSSYQGTGAGSRRESLSGSASSRGDFLPRCLR